MFDKIRPLCAKNLFSWCINPCQMGEMWVDAASNDFGVDFFEFFDTIGKGQNFSWAHKCTGNYNKFEIEALAIVSIRYTDIYVNENTYKSNG